MTERYDVVVAGLGGMGSAVAFHLARHGLRVLGLDRYAPPHTLGSSHGESRIIREAYFEHPAYVPLVQRAYQLWVELEQLTGRALLRITGGVILGEPESAAVRGALQSAELHGLPHERLDAGEVHRRFPALQPMPGQVGVYEPRAGILDPEACVAAHLEAARERGAELGLEEPLTHWRATADGVQIVTPKRRCEADTLVLAVGPWLPGLLPELPLEIERQVVVWLRPAGDPQTVAPGRCPVFLWDAGTEMIYGLPDLGRGFKAALHHGGARYARVEEVPRQVEAEDVAAVRRLLAQVAPAANGELLRAGTCLYTDTPDEHFLLDLHPEHPRVWLASACSGHGFKFTSALGELLAERITGGTSRLDTPLFGLARLAARQG